MKKFGREEKFIAICVAAAAILIAATVILTPQATVRDQRPTSYNTGDAGLKAAFLALPRLGYTTLRWERPASELSAVDAEHSAVVIADPQADMTANEADGVRDYLRRGGWVLATGATAAALLLPDVSSLELDDRGCASEPEGMTAIARIPRVRFQQSFKWKKLPPELEFARSCGDRAAVLLVRTGKGTAVLWSEAKPMSNAGVKQDENLQLLLASLPAERRTVYFDEYVHDYQDYLWSRAKETPLWALKMQLALLALAILFSFARRHGPLRELETIPRTSPLEFAHSMGNVYHRGEAGEAAMEQARRGLFKFFEDRCGLSRETLNGGARAICEALETRLGYCNPKLEPLLEPVEARMKPAQALAQVQVLLEARAEVGRIVKKAQRIEERKTGV